MNKIASQVSQRLLCNNVFGFSSTHYLRNVESNPIKERVMSTPTWPAPYYQRLHRAYPIRQQKNINLAIEAPFNDKNWYNAKQALSSTVQGRQTVHYTEQHVRTNTYSITKSDCESMVRAYVNDLSQFLDLANKENVKILAGKTLI